MSHLRVPVGRSGIGRHEVWEECALIEQIATYFKSYSNFNLVHPEVQTSSSTSFPVAGMKLTDLTSPSYLASLTHRAVL